MKFNEKYDSYLNSFEGFMKTIFYKYICGCVPIREAMEYSINAGGKRIRPVLMCAIADSMGMDMSFVAPYGAAIEFIHTYSLIHDDLPAMDDDDFRRGKPSNHKVYGEAMAILAGDSLLNLAYEVMSDYVIANSKLNTVSNHAIAMNYIAKCAGGRGMVGGQVYDLEAENVSVDIKRLELIHLLKTGALIRACVVVPGIVKGKDPEYIKKLERVGNNLGMIFQIKDDILDVEGDKEILGKSIGKDEKSGKATYVTLLGIDEAKKLLIDICEKNVELLKELELSNEFMLGMIEFLRDREK